MLRELLERLRDAELRPVDADSLLGVGSQILEIIQNPASNLLAAVILLLIVSLFLLILTLSAIMLIGGPADEEAVRERPVDISYDDSPPAAPTPTRVRFSAPYSAVLKALGVLLLLLVVTGLSSQSRSVCLSCHAGTAHTDAVAEDVHQTISCVACHEQGGPVDALTIGLALRMQHIVAGMTDSPPQGGFGIVTGRACLRCHSGIGESVTENPNRALRVSHKEPLESGAGCMDCHVLDDLERIGRRTVGMASCLRCHDGVDASAECVTCHTGDVSQAVLVSRTHEPRQAVTRPDCYTCHDPRPCDSCHGVRLPHPEFYARTHMMDAAREIWFEGGRTCTTCHTSERNSCYQRGCHFNELDYHRAQDPGFPRNHGSRDMMCNDCHPYAGEFDNPCRMCHSE